ncbi:MAG TPA: iron-containing redox enzyme family protein [Baekduia sp.]|uniref:iron-containing redox enzyme family protein n=1 Tax=Baekduia sp. TaxID=2600305 RepID=UPI002B644677|nr:iron-containing redox enzyme family protein [Baekduia sp.]HMJ35465.1 iron-containing redox enzyme family protein [Baekduia sp.]
MDTVDATRFFDEHVTADAVHENIAAVDLAGGLVRVEPTLIDDILFGAQALVELEARWAAVLLDAWHAAQTALHAALDATVGAHTRPSTSALPAAASRPTTRARRHPQLSRHRGTVGPRLRCGGRICSRAMVIPAARRSAAEGSGDARRWPMSRWRGRCVPVGYRLVMRFSAPLLTDAGRQHA